LQSRGYRRFELAIATLLAIVFAGFLYEALRIGPSVHESLNGLIPGLNGIDSIYLAVGIIGATVMPHAIYLHSALTNGRMPVRNDAERRRVLRFERTDVIIALGLAGVINIAMLAVAAKLLHGSGLSGVSTIQGAHAELGRLAVLSQVVLSFGIPFALVPLVVLTGRRDVMGVHVNRRLTSVIAYGVVVAISAMNLSLIYQQLF
jgi:Mn2+/Fe2+ NRAMP family transporter